MKTKFFTFVFLLLAIFSCKTTQLDIAQPKEEYLQPETPTDPSTIGLRLNIDMKELEKSLNASMKGLIYEDSIFEDDNMLVKVWNTGNIKFNMRGSLITYQLPLRVWYKTGFKKNVFGVTIQDYYEAKGAMTVDMSSRFFLSPNWNIETKSKVAKYVWTEEPVIKAAGRIIPAKKLANFILSAFHSNIIQSIDDKVSEKIDLRNTMIAKWNEIQDPIQVNEDFDVWIKISPKELLAEPIHANNDLVQINVGLNAIIQTFIGNQPDSTKIKTTIPNFKQRQHIQPYFSIYSNIEVPFSKLTDIANEMIVGKEFKKGRKTVRIDSLAIWGQQDTVIIKASVSGSVKGDLFCSGTLHVVDSTQTLKIEHFDFDMNTRNSLLKSADWMMHKGFLKMIEPMLTIQLSEQVKSLMSMSNELLKNYKYDKGMYLNGQLNNIELRDIIMTKDGFIISGKIDGKMNVNIKDWF